MPGVVTHLNVAYVFYKEYGMPSDLGRFLIGAVCPDSVNLNGHAPKSVRWPAHLRDSDLFRWEQNAKQFYVDNKDKYDESYLLGYIMHIVTDIVWDREYDGPLCIKLYKDGVPKDYLKKMRWREIDGYESKQLNCEWFKKALESLKDAKVSDIGTLNEDDIAMWRQEILKKQYGECLTSQYIDDEFMNSFFKDVCENMLKIINA